MSKSLLLTALALMVNFSLPCNANESNNYSWDGLEQFDSNETQKIQNWLNFVRHATESTIGPYPFKVELHLNRRSSNEPVPWANTRRDVPQSIHFYIDTRFSLQQFIDDWTAYHELSHLALPFLGEDGRWFAEGFASYMQYQIMAKQDVLNETPEQAYDRKFSPYRQLYQSNSAALARINELFEQRQFRPAYWGSAQFFIMADQQLDERGIKLVELVNDYVTCCRMADETLSDIINSWDKLSGTNVFSHLLEQFKNAPSSSLLSIKQTMTSPRIDY